MWNINCWKKRSLHTQITKYKQIEEKKVVDRCKCKKQNTHKCKLENLHVKSKDLKVLMKTKLFIWLEVAKNNSYKANMSSSMSMSWLLQKN
jgi:uncharacterized membrane protein